MPLLVLFFCENRPCAGTLRLPSAAGAARCGSAAPVFASWDACSANRDTSLRLRGGAPRKGPDVNDVDWRAVSGNLLGGLTLFLYSMQKLSDGIQAACGDELKSMLKVLSFNRYIGFLTGIAVCGVTNSLSCVAVLLVSFVSAELIPLQRCFGILLGACVGSTLISYLVVFKIVDYGLFLVFFGFCFSEYSRVPTRRDIGSATFGLGLLFFSMEVMSNAFAFMKHHKGFLNLLSSMENPYLGFVTSSIFTGIIQSSGAMMAILLQLSGQGMLGMNSCCGLMLGANVGTCVTGLLAAIGRSREALRLAVALLLFRLVSAILVLPFSTQFNALVASVCRVQIKSKQPEDITMMLATSHTLFNLIFALGVLPVCHHGVTIIRRIIPPTPAEIFRDEQKAAKKAKEAAAAAKIASKEAAQLQKAAAKSR